MTKTLKYSAFISYSHADTAFVAWLHRALEGYRLPKRLVGRETSFGVVPRKLPPFFRDRDDLSAATNLTESVLGALREARFLIVVCSPDAAKSKWVNKEIEAYRKIHGKKNILCVIADNNPNAEDKKSLSFFPEAILNLKKSGDYEPIAADARAEGDGRRLAKLKLIAGILGLELDQVIQRDAARRQVRMGLGIGASAVMTLTLSVLLYLAIEAREAAEKAQNFAEDKRGQAEELVDFMLDDLKTKLEPIGSLQVLDDIAMQALGYYAAMDLNELDAETLSRRSEVLLMIGDIEQKRGNLELAQTVFEQAALTTGELLNQAPEDPERIFNHSQSIYWLAYTKMIQGNLAGAEAGFQEYSAFARKLSASDPNNPDWEIEVGYADSNLGTVMYNQGKFAEARQEFLKALELFERLAAKTPDDAFTQFDLAQSYAWLADANMNLGNLTEATDQRQKEAAIYDALLQKNPQDNQIKGAMMVTQERLGRLYTYQGDTQKASGPFLSGMALAEDLISFDPENTWPIQNLSHLLLGVLEMSAMNLKPREQKPLLEKLEVYTADLVERDPGNPNWQALLVRARVLRAKTLMDGGALDEALALAEEAWQPQTDLLAANPGNYSLLEPMGCAALLLTMILQKDGREGEGAPYLKAFLEAAGSRGGRVNLRTRDYMGRADFFLGLTDEAKENKDFLLDLGYRAPDFTAFWGPKADE